MFNVNKEKEIKRLINKKRKELGITREELCAISGITSRTLRRFMNGEHDLKLGNLIEILTTLEIEIKFESV